MPEKLLIQNNACLPAKVDIVFWRIRILVSTNHYIGTTYLTQKSNAAALHTPRDYLHIASLLCRIEEFSVGHEEKIIIPRSICFRFVFIINNTASHCQILLLTSNRKNKQSG